ncbi:uncharacterized protein G2W53_044873 [Senna tora]|uniref:Uncharacterized protein n=1 Tax=Senna tora TaxID=362788 RepID=A0A834SD73_9FABA|nr:uncharacterized protein G2W53_044873 [Senna tora]
MPPELQSLWHRHHGLNRRICSQFWPRIYQTQSVGAGRSEKRHWIVESRWF